MAIFNDTFTVYERLASKKMISLITEINGHTHGGGYGVNINFSDLYGRISDGTGLIASQLPLGKWILSTMIANGAITSDAITDGSIGLLKLNLSQIHLDASTGYAVYAP